MRIGLSQSLQLRPVKRPSETKNNNNYFVRLSPATAKRLRDLALEGLRDDDLIAKGGDRSWTVSVEGSSSSCQSGIEFLPLAIATDEGDTLYSSYNGGDLEVDDSGMCVDTFLTVSKPMIESVICHYR